VAADHLLRTHFVVDSETMAHQSLGSEQIRSVAQRPDRLNTFHFNLLLKLFLTFGRSAKWKPRSISQIN